MRYRTLSLATLVAAAAVATTAAISTVTHADPAPSPQDAATKDSRIEQLSLGEYWFGPDITKDDLVGKVVLVEIWGS